MRDVFKKLWRDERKAREQVERYTEGKWTLLADREEVPEDAHQCYYCTDFAYLSMVQCKHHKIHYCLLH